VGKTRVLAWKMEQEVAWEKKYLKVGMDKIWSEQGKLTDQPVCIQSM
jgi:hypothetical protein